MKFKYLIIAFCAIIFIILLAVVFLPLVLTNGVTAVNLKYITLPLFGFIVLLLTGISTFFFLNYRLLSLLEREDWPALAYYLEQRIYVKRQYTARNVKLLASSYMVISDFASVLKLESKVQLKKPALVLKNVLIFGSARVLSGKHAEAASFFKSYISKSKGKEKEWTRLYYGFSNLLNGAFNSAESEFLSLAVSSSDAVISGLSSYFLFHSIEKHSSNPEKCRQASMNGRERVIDALGGINGWNREVSKMGTEIHVAIIKKYIDSAGTWLFDEEIMAERLENEQAESQERRSDNRRKGQRRANTRSSEDRRKGDRRTKDNL